MTSSDDGLGANRTSDLGDEDEEEFNGLAERLRSRQGDYSHILAGGCLGGGGGGHNQQSCNFVDSDGMSSQGTQRSSTTNTATSANTTQTNSATNGSPSSGIGGEPVIHPTMLINCNQHHCLGSTGNTAHVANYGDNNGYDAQTGHSSEHQHQISGAGSSASSIPLASDGNQEPGGDGCDSNSHGHKTPERHHDGAEYLLPISAQANDDQQQLSSMRQMIQFSALRPATKKSAGLRHNTKSVS